MRLIVVLVGLAAAVASAAPGAQARVQFRIYDPTGATKVEVTIVDVLRSSARAKREPDGTGVLAFSVTKRGRIKFHLLTRAVARRGARLHRLQRIAMNIDGAMSRPIIDYHATPDGLDARGPMVVTLPRYSLAQRLASAIRQG